MQCLISCSLMDNVMFSISFLKSKQPNGRRSYILIRAVCKCCQDVNIHFGWHCHLVLYINSLLTLSSQTTVNWRSWQAARNSFANIFKISQHSYKKRQMEIRTFPSRLKVTEAFWSLLTSFSPFVGFNPITLGSSSDFSEHILTKLQNTMQWLLLFLLLNWRVNEELTNFDFTFCSGQLHRSGNSSQLYTGK